MDNQAYQAPQANLDIEIEEQYQSYQYFNLRGRINRLKYLQLAYFLPTLLFFVYLFGVVAALSIVNRNPTSQGKGFLMFSYLNWGLVVILVLGVINGLWLSVQRAHDMGYKGVWAVLCLLPLINAAFLIVPPEAKANNYGQMPAENSLLVAITGWLGLAGVALYYLLFAILVSNLF
ncbi:MAG: DUF805 domain-containing protein [Gammaproteobacteria bacterium]|nr:DUF805 domain-containing protein [Gammaproteobacteria bacterium]